MAFWNKLRRICHPKSYINILLYALIVFVIVYLVITNTSNIQVRNIITKTVINKARIHLNNEQNIKTDVEDQDVLAQKSTDSILEKEFQKDVEIAKIPCNPASITPKHIIHEEKISCKPHIASKSACEFAQRLYYRDDKLKTCGYSRNVQICQFTERFTLEGVTFVYKCSLRDCLKYKRDKLIVRVFDPSTQTIEEKAIFTDVHKLESQIPLIAKSSSASGYNFLFLECSDGRNDREAYDAIAQFLLLPPIELIKQKKKRQFLKHLQRKNVNSKINVNIVLLDSAARSHFYRSLPFTIDTFNDINNNKHSEVLDFELFQSVEGHTAENLHALFTGTLFPKHWTGTEREGSLVGAGELFKKFVSNGYTTFYQDDLCFDEWWGVRLDMGSPSTWNQFMESFRTNFIHHAGLTFSSCKILQTNNVTNPFNGPDGPLCFNGKFQDAYYLDFDYNHHEFASRNNIKLLSFTALNVAHDHTGRRIQSIDLELANFVKRISHSKNTLTFLLADHGNTYTHYTHAVMEGRFEQYHPSFFLIIPQGVQNMLGDNIMKNLRANQKHLITMLDLHDALENIPIRPKETGIFGGISPKRTCDDLDLRLPNLCVCEGWDAEALNDTRQLGVLDFAVGQLNNKILAYQESVRINKHIPKCKRLVPLSFTNVRERNKDGFLITSIDFTTSPGRGAGQSHDVFHVQVQSNIDPAQESRDMKLLNFDRISKYGPYRKCADKGIDMRLCVCDMKPVKEVVPLETFVLNEISWNEPILAAKDLSLEHRNRISKCLYYRTISYPDLSEKEESIFSSSYEVANICDKKLNVTLHVYLDNMKSTQVSPITKEVNAYGVTYIGSMMRAVPYWNSRVESAMFSITESEFLFPELI